jgi:hypothetical protein
VGARNEATGGPWPGRSALPAEGHEIEGRGSGADPVFSKGWAPKPVQFATLTRRSTGLCEQGIFLSAEM